MHPVPLVVRRRLKKGGECYHEILGITRATPVESSGRGEDHASMVIVGGNPRTNDTVKVLGVLGDDRPVIGAGASEEFLVGHGHRYRVIGSRHDVIALVTQSLGRSRRMVCVEQ
jgi:hypothetical protein